jgi:hypothetical protein
MGIKGHLGFCYKDGKLTINIENKAFFYGEKYKSGNC